jgi:hypothetical protein
MTTQSVQATRSPLVRSAAVILAIVLTVAAVPAAAEDDVYYPISMCIGTNEFGEPWPAIRFRSGIAENFSESEIRLLVCPVPYTRNLNDLQPIIVRVNGFDNNNGDDGFIRVQLCEKFLDSGGSCHDTAASGQSYIGFTTLEVEFTPTSSTRWIYFTVDVPDQDTQSGRSYVNGYRVCRGNCP